MKQLFFSLAFVVSIFTSVNAQESAQNNPTTGDLFSGLTRPLTFSRMIPPYALEVTFSKTVHIIFPAAIRYVDLGSINLLAGKADGTENVLRVKAAARGFSNETNLSVITDDGSYYTFNVKYADEPVKLSVEMADFLHGWNSEAKPGNDIPVYMSDLGEASPWMLRLIMETIHKGNKTKIKHIGSRNFGVQYLLKSIYTHNDVLFFHLQLKNRSSVSYQIDYLTFKIVDKKVAKRTAMQEQVILPLRSYNQVTDVSGRKEERTVFALPKFTIPNDKQLIIELTERDGGRSQTLFIENTDLIRANQVDNLKLKVK
jgi:conjugative transposon TraN protein